tara:strand:- start:20 stop:529 length:510 start_codon:yes stop_codon:yes gene_type:complete
MPGHYNEKDPHTLKPGKSKLHGMFQNIKHNPNQPYHFIRSIGAGLTFLPIGRAVGAGVKLIRSRIGVGAATKLGAGGKLTNKLLKSEHMAPSLNTNRIAQSFVDKQIKHLTKDVPKLTTREKVTGMSEEFFANVGRNLGDKARFGGGRTTEPFILGTNRIKNPLKQFNK